ncbi:MAG: rod shape-determining protein RodA, partial [Novosphingobium sp. 17-62-8]
MPRAYVPAAIARQPWGVLLPLMALVGFGAAVLDSAAGGRFDIWALSHLVRFSVFLVMAMIIARLPQQLFRQMALPAYGVLCALLVLVELIGGMGGGSQRWLNLGFMTLQPSELMKPG